MERLDRLPEILFMSFSERSRRALVDWVLNGVPGLEEGCLLGVSALGVPGLWPASEPKESLWTSCATGLSLAPSWGLGVRGWEEGSRAAKGVSAGSGEVVGETGTEAGSARELSLTELRLCARTRAQLVERKLSASSQKRTRWSAPRVSRNRV